MGRCSRIAPRPGPGERQWDRRAGAGDPARRVEAPPNRQPSLQALWGQDLGTEGRGDRR